jgi:hypothetical protein
MIRLTKSIPHLSSARTGCRLHFGIPDALESGDCGFAESPLLYHWCGAGQLE